MFCQTMDQCTDNFECLVIHNCARSNKLEDQVFWYKAEPHPDFRLGAEILWKQAMAMQQDDSDDDEDNGDFLSKYNNGKRKKGMQFEVKKTHR